VLTTPVFRVLKQQIGAEVHHLCKPQFAKVLELNPHIDRQWKLETDIKEYILSIGIWILVTNFPLRMTERD